MKSGTWVRPLSTLAVVLLSLVVSESCCGIALFVIPNLEGPIGMFPLYSEIVGIDSFGAVLPLLLCGVFGVYLSLFAKLKGRKIPFNGRQFWLSIPFVMLLALGVFGYAQATNGSMVLSDSEATLIIPFGAVLGVVYAIVRDSRIQAVAVGGEVYTVGVLGMFLSDLVRTFSGLSQAPGEYLIWGGGGLHDLVLWFGAYMATAALSYRFLIPRLRFNETKDPGKVVQANRVIVGCWSRSAQTLKW